MKPVALIAALAELGLVVYLVVDFPSGQAGFQVISQHSWIGQFGISWKLGVDGLSLFLLVGMTAVLFPIAMFRLPSEWQPQALHGLDAAPRKRPAWAASSCRWISSSSS